MDSNLFWLLVLFSGITCVLTYVFLIRREKDFGGLGKFGALAFGGFLIPLVCYVLWEQSQAIERLSALGFASYPGFGAAQGVATGFGQRPTWVFKVDNESAVLDFYRQAENRGGWELRAESPTMLLFSNGSRTVSIAVSGGSVSVMLIEAEKNEPNITMESDT